MSTKKGKKREFWRKEGREEKSKRERKEGKKEELERRKEGGKRMAKEDKGKEKGEGEEN